MIGRGAEAELRCYLSGVKFVQVSSCIVASGLTAINRLCKSANIPVHPRFSKVRVVLFSKFSVQK